MGLFDMQVPIEMEIPEKTLINKKNLREAIKFLENQSRIEIGFESPSMAFRTATETIVMRMSEGDFPAYGQVFKVESESFIVDMPKIKDALKRVSILSDKEYYGAEFRFEPEKLTIEMENAEFGRAVESVPVEYTGEPITTRFNPRLTFDLISGIESAKLSGKVDKDAKPCILTGSDNQSLIFAVMPMRY
jgi:DNA polymerase-3 subunit beta